LTAEFDSAIVWPAIVRHRDDPLFEWVADGAELEMVAGTRQPGQAIDWIVVDSAGKVFSNGRPHALESQALTRWMREHAEIQGACCVGKLTVETAHQAIELVRKLDA